MPSKSISVGQAANSSSVWTVYAGNISQRIKNAGISFTPREDDLKKVKEWMDKTKKPCEFVLTYDGDGLTLEARVGSSKDSPVQFNLSAEKDVKKRRETLVNLGKHFPQLVTQTDLSAFDKAHPDPARLQEMKAQIDAKAAEIKDLEKKLADAKKEKAELEQRYRALGGR